MEKKYRYALKTVDRQKGCDEFTACTSLQQAQELWQSCTVRDKAAVIDVISGRTILKKG